MGHPHIGAGGRHLYINVPDSNVLFDSLLWVYEGGIEPQNTLLNMPNATNLQFTGSHVVNVLAPLADAYCPAGLVTGNLIVGDLQGGIQVNLGHFRSVIVPEPASLCVLAMSGIALLRRRYRVSRRWM